MKFKSFRLIITIMQSSKSQASLGTDKLIVLAELTNDLFLVFTHMNLLHEISNEKCLITITVNIQWLSLILTPLRSYLKTYYIYVCVSFFIIDIVYYILNLHFGNHSIIYKYRRRVFLP